MTIHLKTQRETLSNKLEAMRPDITKKDKEKVNEITNYSFPTISNYLNGKGKDLDTMATLIAEFAKLIEARGKKAQIIPLDGTVKGVA